MSPAQQVKAAFDWLGWSRFGWMIGVAAFGLVWWAAWNLSAISSSITLLNETVIEIKTSVDEQDKKFDRALEDRHYLGEQVIQIKERLISLEKRLDRIESNAHSH